MDFGLVLNEMKFSLICNLILEDVKFNKRNVIANILFPFKGNGPFLADIFVSMLKLLGRVFSAKAFQRSRYARVDGGRC